MTSQFIQEKPKNETALESMRLYLLAGGIFTLTMGLLFGVFAGTHIQDLQTLAEFPGMIWSIACGKPVEGGPVLPLLLTFSIVSLLASGFIFGWRWWISRSR